MFAWWIQEPTILAGSCPTDDQLRRLYAEGFRIIVSLIDEREQPPLYNRDHVIDMGYRRYNIPVSEGRFPTIDQIEQFLRLLYQQRNDRKIIVHCLSGDKRTGAMTMAYWMSQGMSEDVARNEIPLRRKRAIHIGRQEIRDYFPLHKWEDQKHEDSENQRNCEEMGSERRNRSDQGGNYQGYPDQRGLYGLFRD